MAAVSITLNVIKSKNIDNKWLAASGSSSPIEALGSPATAKAKRLADLFRPPFDIMYHGNFEEARDTAKEKNKWLMINVQNPTEFACQVMNRDLWSDSFVKDIVKESFIFLQVINTDIHVVKPVLTCVIVYKRKCRW